MTVAGGLEIRPGSVADLPALVAVFGQRRWFSDQLARQRAGGGSCWWPGSRTTRPATCT